MSWTLHLLRIGITLALVGCASAPPPPPVVVSDEDLGTVRAILASQASDSSASKDFQVSEIDVRDRVVMLELEAESHGRGWERTDRAKCRRCADDGEWSCAV